VKRNTMTRLAHLMRPTCLAMLLIASTAATSSAQSGSEPIRRPSQAQPANAFGQSKPNPKTEGAIRIATYNMLNFFDPFDDPSLEGEYDDAEMVTSPARCEVLAETIREMDADILALQEVESKKALEWFRDKYLPDMGYKYIASKDVGYYRGIECSIMSRFEITDSRVWPNMNLDDVQREGPGWDDVPPEDRSGLTFQRSPICATIQVDQDYELVVFSVHHKSGRNNRYHREAEALRIVEFIEQIRREDPHANMVVMGDFNAAPWDKSLRVYLEAGLIDTLAHRIIPRWRNADESEARLYKTHESDRVLDYILMNSGTHREYVIDSAHVFGTLMPPESYDWRRDPKPQGYASDHYPVILDLKPDDQL